MKSFLPLLSLALFVTGCSTAYNSGQTPDDVYFSPERPQNEYVRMESKQNKYRYEESEDDRYLRMKVRNRRLWSDLSYYYNDPIAYNYYYNRYNNFYIGHSPWNYYNTWNYYYNPYSYYNPYGNKYGTPVYVVTPKSSNYNRPRQHNLNVYNNPAPNGNSPRVSNSNGKRVFSNNGSAGRPSYGTPSANTGSNMRSVFGNSNSSSSSSTPARTQSSSSSNNNSSSGSSSGKSGNAGVRKF